MSTSKKYPGSELHVGIDLGTTNSAVATAMFQNNKLSTPVLRVERKTEMGPHGTYIKEKGQLLPSCVMYLDSAQGYETSVGDFAKKAARTKPYAVATSIKSQMGQPVVDIPGWKKEYPDQTPEEVSARILKVFREQLNSQFYEDVQDAVITVPASFNAAQSEATLRAAEIAGFQVRNEDGSFRDDVLLSEPEAVIYDVLNQLQNGEIHLDMDFTEPKNVMVFDIGGGTLDITLHEVRRNSENTQVFDMKPVATNRYSSVAGDTFDRLLARRMLDIYLKDLGESDYAAATRLRKDDTGAMRQMLFFAEELKRNISDRHEEQKNLGRELPKTAVIDYGGEMPDGYSCENCMSVEDFEEILRPLMGEEYAFSDYLTPAKLTNERNIIFPVLNVLGKASEKLGTEAVRVDAVILNGGMSRLYMIEDRLKRFFGLNPIKVGDPDKSVAQGAAVYHYYLQQAEYDIPVGRMEISHEAHGNPVRNTFRNMTEPEAGAYSGYTATENPVPAPAVRAPMIRTLGAVQNETIYLGLRGGAVVPLVKSGADLPYHCDMTEGFEIQAGQQYLKFPIKLKEGKTYRTIACGNIALNSAYSTNTPVALSFDMRRDGILTFAMSVAGKTVGNTSVTFGEDKSGGYSLNRGKGIKQKRVTGAYLSPECVLSDFKKQAMLIAESGKNAAQRQKAIASIRKNKEAMLACGNPEDFSTAILKMLRTAKSDTLLLHLLPVARKLSRYWEEFEREEFCRICMNRLASEVRFSGAYGDGINACIEAIHAVGACGSAEDVAVIFPLHKNHRYVNSMLRSCGLAGYEPNWVYNEMMNKVRTDGPMQDSMSAMGLMAGGAREALTEKQLKTWAETLIQLIEEDKLDNNTLHIGLVTLALVAMRNPKTDVGAPLRTRALRLVENLSWYCNPEAIKNATKAIGVTTRLLQSGEIAEEDEQYLLKLLDE